MDPVSVIEGSMVPLDRADIDTDQIMPKQFLKRVERVGFGEFIFLDWRDDPEFVLNDARYAGGTVLVTGPNFGAGSSREHAPWGLQQYGFQALIAPSFADIFAANCAKIGLLTVELPGPLCGTLIDLATEDAAARVTIDLPDQRITAQGVTATFDIDPHRKHMLRNGLDEIQLAVDREDDIAAYEATRPKWAPVTIHPRGQR